MSLSSANSKNGDSCGLTTFAIASNSFNYLDAVLSSMVALLDNFCSLFRPLANACSASVLDRRRSRRVPGFDLARPDGTAGAFLEKSWVRELPREKNFELASATTILAHKPE